MGSIETRAVRVAAVAALLVEDQQRAAAPRGRPPQSLSKGKWWDPAEMVLAMVRDEQKRLAEECGDRRRPASEWLMSLAMEMGALAAAVEGAGPLDGPAAEACDALRRAAEAAGRWVLARPPENPSLPAP